MTSPVGADTQQAGVFWMATDPGETRPGLLYLAREASSELVVNPELYPAFEFTEVEVAADGSTKSTVALSKDRGPQTLHGQVIAETGESLPVSLLEAHSIRWNSSNQTFRPIWSLVGGHIEPRHPFRVLLGGRRLSGQCAQRPEPGDGTALATRPVR